MRNLPRLPLLALTFALAISPALVACGNKGPLVLPDQAAQADKDKDKKKAAPAPAPVTIPPPASGSGTR